MLLLPLAVVRLERSLHAWPPRTPGPRKWALGAARTADVEPSRTRTGGQARRPSVRLRDTARQSGPGPVEPNGRVERSRRTVRLGISPSRVNFRRPRMWTPPARILVGVAAALVTSATPTFGRYRASETSPKRPSLVTHRSPRTPTAESGSHTTAASPHLWIFLWTTGGAAWSLQQRTTCGPRSRQQSAPNSSEATWNTWFQGVQALDLTDDTLVLGVPSSVAVERIRTSYLGLIADAAQALTGVPLDGRTARRHRTPPRRAGRARRGRRCVRRSGFRGRHLGHEPIGPQRLGRVDGAGRNRVPAGQHHDAEPPLHVRRFRDRHLEPVRPRRRPFGGREPGAVLQPAVHLRTRRTRQDPPVARDRPSRAGAVLVEARPVRVDRDDDERVRRIDAFEEHARLQAPLPRGRRAARRRHPVPRTHRAAPGRVLLHVQRPAQPGQPDRDLLGPSAEVDRDDRRPAAQPLRVGPDHRHPAPGVRDAPRDPSQEGRVRTPRRHPRRRARVHRRARRRQRP